MKASKIREWASAWRDKAATEHPKWRQTQLPTSSMLSQIQRRLTSTTIATSERALHDFVFNVNSNEGEGSETVEEARHLLTKHRSSRRTTIHDMVREPPCEMSKGGGADNLHDRLKTDVNLYDAYTLLVEQWCADDTPHNAGVPRLCITRIKQLHFVLFRNREFWDEAGHYRSKPVYIGLPDGSFLDMEPQQSISQEPLGVTNTMLEDVFYGGDQETRVARLIYLVCSFFIAYERIHPFIDGNGRTGRLLMAYLLSSLTPFGPNTFYLDDEASRGMISDRWTYLSCFQQKAGDVEQPWNLIALVVEGIYVAWKMFSVNAEES